MTDHVRQFNVEQNSEDVEINKTLEIQVVNNNEKNDRLIEDKSQQCTLTQMNKQQNKRNLNKPKIDEQSQSGQEYEQQNKQIHENNNKESQQMINIMDKIEGSHPIQKKTLKPDSLQHDIKLGWIPKTQVTGPIPLSFSHPFLDTLIQNKINSFKIIYLGYRPINSFEIHQKYYGDSKNYPFFQFHLCKSQFLDRFFKKYYPDYQFHNQNQKNLSRQKKIKQNEQNKQTINEDLIFNSDYQGGNLDAVYFQEQEHRLIIRVDSNTRGHCNYYNFKIKCNKQGKYCFRIMNMSKKKSLYERGMKPYIKVCNSKIKQQNQWSQCDETLCSKVKFSLSPLNQIPSQEFKQFYSLKFQLQLKSQCEYQLCYNIPYTYSQLIKQISTIRDNKNVHVTKLGYSLSGVQIPLLTITDQKQNKIAKVNKKQEDNIFYVVITGRIHPAESNSSHIVNGIIKYLTKSVPESQNIKKNIVFKIIPMLNPDGVILGNTRTGFAGKDLNRKFSNKSELIFPEVNNLKDYVLKIKQKYGKKLLFVIDIHGHSTRKGSFFFGPQYPILDEQYSKCRLLPKLYAMRSEAFRYYSCKFKISHGKEATSRGFFNSNDIRTYTHQTSVHSFYDFTSRKDLSFTQKSLQTLGKNLAISIFDYVQKVHILVNEVQQIKNLLLKPQQTPKPKDGVYKVEKNIEKNFQDQERESDKMPSDKADSESDTDDIEDKKLNVFYQRINQNKEYFYDQIVKMLKNKNDSLGNSKKQKKIKLNQIQKDKQKQKEKQKLLKNQKRKTNSNWSSHKASNYTPKKTLFAEYSKISLDIRKNPTEKSPIKVTSKIQLNIKKNKQGLHRRSNSERNSEEFFNGFQKVKIQGNTNRIIYSVPNIKWDYNSNHNSQNFTERNQTYRFDMNDYTKTQLRQKKDKIKHSKIMQNIFVQKQEKKLKINRQLLEKLLVPSTNSVVNSLGKNQVKISPIKQKKHKFSTSVNEYFPNTDYRIFAAFSQINKLDNLNYYEQKRGNMPYEKQNNRDNQNGPLIETKKEQYLCKKWQKQIVLKTKRNLSFGGKTQTSDTRMVTPQSSFVKTSSKILSKYVETQDVQRFKKDKQTFPKIYLNKKQIIVINESKE